MLKFAHEAMATRFELVVSGASRHRAAGAAQEVFADIDRLEGELSRFRPDSDIARLRALGSGDSARVGFAAIDCLLLAKDVHAATGGAFDVAVAPLWEVWRGQDGAVREPSEAELARAAEVSGSHLFDVDPESLTVTSHTCGLHLDLGGIGKGYALDQAAEILRRWEVTAALLNAGDSTVLALDPPGPDRAWRAGVGGTGRGSVDLAHRALSGSGFSVKGAHIIDPRRGRPVAPGSGNGHAWASAPDAALADALSTAFMVMSRDEIDAFCTQHPDAEAVYFEPSLPGPV